MTRWKAKNIGGTLKMLQDCHKRLQQSVVASDDNDYLTPSHLYEGSREHAAVITALTNKSGYGGIIISLPNGPDSGVHEIAEAYFEPDIDDKEIETLLECHLAEIGKMNKVFRAPGKLSEGIYRNKRDVYEKEIGSVERKGKSYTVKLLSSSELEKVGPLMLDAWNFPEKEFYNMAMPSGFLNAVGTTVGILDESDELIAFSFSVPTNAPKRALSHATGVKKSLQGMGIGEVIKRAQFEQLREEGYNFTEWTYDPLLAINSSINIKKLGARCNTYLEDVYGAITKGGLYMEDIADRFLVEVDLRKPNRIIREEHPEDVAILAMNDDLPTTQGEFGEVVAVEIPSNFSELKERKKREGENIPETALKWRLTTRKVFQDIFERGYVVDGFERTEDGRTFYLARKDGK